MAVVNHEEGVVFECFRQNRYIWVSAQSLECFRIRFHELAFNGHDLQLGVEGGEESCHHVLKTIENRKDAHQCCCGDGYTTNGHARDDIDGVVRLLGKKIAGGDVEGEVQRIEFDEVSWLLLKKPVDVVNIVERVIKEEFEFRNDTKLVTLQFAQFKTNLRGVVVHVL